jgi:hypothetical protein
MDLKMIEWRSIDRLPEQGQTVAVLYRHWKSSKPTSFAIYFGQVLYLTDGRWAVINNDDLGLGSFVMESEIDFDVWCPHIEINF